MKAKIVIRKVENKFYVADIPGLKPTCHSLGNSIKKVLEDIYKQLAGTTFELNQSDLVTLNQEDNLKSFDIPQLIASAHEAQAQTFGVCKFCSQKLPSGWMSQQDVCQSCAEKHLGILY